jgi:hypothetical protein
VAPTPSMPRARMTRRRSRDQAADASVVRGSSRLHGIDPFEKALREQKWVAEVKAIIGK